jgi:acyl-CoA thioesterase-1
MRRCLGLMMCCGLLLGGIGSAGAAAPKTAVKTVLVLGDSLSAAHNIPIESGWVFCWTRACPTWCRSALAINASISGETSLSGRNRLPALLQKYHPSVLVIELGANDGLQGLPLPALRDNLTAMIDMAQKQKIARAAARYRAAGELRSAVP